MSGADNIVEFSSSAMLIEQAKHERQRLQQQIEQSQRTIERSREIIERIDKVLVAAETE
jgi:hypothetical protein